MTLVSSGMLCLGSAGGVADNRSVQAELGAAGTLCLATALSDAGISGNCLSDFYGYSAATTECSMNTQVADAFGSGASYWADSSVSTGVSPLISLQVQWNGANVYNDNSGGGQGTTSVTGSDGATYTRDSYLGSLLDTDWYNVCRTG